MGFIFSYLGILWVTFPLIWKELWVQILNQNSVSPSKTRLSYLHPPDVQMYTSIYLDGVPNHFTERWWGMKTNSMFKMGYEVFFDYVKLSSALVPRIKNDHSLKW